LARDADSLDKAKLKEKRQILRKACTREAREKLRQAHGDQYSVLTMMDAEQDVENLLRKEEKRLGPPVQKPSTIQQPQFQNTQSRRDYKR